MNDDQCTARPPNLLFIYTDEQSIDTLAAYGNTAIEMPNLNRFAEGAAVFEQAYVTQTVCTPSRSSLLTGLYPHTNGCTENNIPLSETIPCLPEMITGRQYATAHYGKWHLGDEVFAQHGFTHWRSIEDGYAKYYRPHRDPQVRSDYHHFLLEHGFSPRKGEIFSRGETARFPEEVSKPAFLAREASAFLRQHREQPFILYVNFLEPHMPFFGPRDHQYDPAHIPLPSTFDDLPGVLAPLKTRLLQRAYYENGHSGLPLKTPADWQRLIANYWGLNSLVDIHVGAILDTLTDCGLDDHTIVVFTSDHGDMMGHQRLLAKCVAFEPAARVPLLIRRPGQTRGKRVRGPVSQIDLAPTLLDLLGQPIPAHLQGCSRRQTLEDPGDSQLQDDVFYEWNGANNGVLGDRIGREGIGPLPAWFAEYGDPQTAAVAFGDRVRTIVTPDGWKFNRSERGEHELYHLNEDPGERRNQAFDPLQRGRLEDLGGRLRAWQQRTQDEVGLVPAP